MTARTPVVHLIDELNQRDPETAAALLAVMQERDEAMRQAAALRRDLYRTRGGAA